MVYTAVIRQRGQLTIPDKVREELDWLKEGEVVGVEISDEEIKIKPYSKARKREVDWDDLWRKIRLSRSFKSKKLGKSMSEFIVEDRERH